MSFLWRKKTSGCRILQRFLSKRDARIASLQWAGHAVQQCGFSSARRPEQNCDARAHLNFDVQPECGVILARPRKPYPRFKHGHRHFTGHSNHTRRFTAQMEANTANEISSSATGM